MPTPEFAVRPANLTTDREQILSVWVRNFSNFDVEQHRRRFNWYYLESPINMGLCWVLVSPSDQRLVGTIGLGIRRIKVGSSVLLAGYLSDFAVDKEFRFTFPALALQKAVLTAAPVELIFTNPNETSRGVVLRSGYKASCSLLRYVRILRVRPYMERIKGLPAGAITVFSAVADVICGFDWGRKARSRNTEIRDVACFDARFNGLWERVNPNLKVSVERTSQFLEWRFTNCPVRTYTTIELIESATERLLGYCTFYLNGDAQANVVDFIADSELSSDELLGGLIERARRAGAASVIFEFNGPVTMQNRLRKFAFLSRPSQAIIAASASGAGIVGGQSDLLNDWYYFRVENDYD